MFFRALILLTFCTQLSATQRFRQQREVPPTDPEISCQDVQDEFFSAQKRQFNFSLGANCTQTTIPGFSLAQIPETLTESEEAIKCKSFLEVQIDHDKILAEHTLIKGLAQLKNNIRARGDALIQSIASEHTKEMSSAGQTLLYDVHRLKNIQSILDPLWQSEDFPSEIKDQLIFNSKGPSPLAKVIGSEDYKTRQEYLSLLCAQTQFSGTNQEQEKKRFFCELYQGQNENLNDDYLEINRVIDFAQKQIPPGQQNFLEFWKPLVDKNVSDILNPQINQKLDELKNVLDQNRQLLSSENCITDQTCQQVEAIRTKLHDLAFELTSHWRGNLNTSFNISNLTLFRKIKDDLEHFFVKKDPPLKNELSQNALPIQITDQIPTERAQVFNQYHQKSMQTLKNIELEQQALLPVAANENCKWLVRHALSTRTEQKMQDWDSLFGDASRLAGDYLQRCQASTQGPQIIARLRLLQDEKNQEYLKTAQNTAEFRIHLKSIITDLNLCTEAENIPIDNNDEFLTAVDQCLAQESSNQLEQRLSQLEAQLLNRQKILDYLQGQNQFKNNSHQKNAALTVINTLCDDYREKLYSEPFYSSDCAVEAPDNTSQLQFLTDHVGRAMGYLYHGNQNLSNSDICASSVLNTELNKTCSYLDYQNKLALFEKNRKVKKEQDYRQYINWKREYLNNHYYDNRTGTYAEYSPLTTYGGGLLAGIAGAFQTGIPMSLISSIFIDTPAAYEAGKSINQYNQQLYLAQQMAQNYPYPNYAYPPTINGYPLLVPRNQFLLTPPPQSLSQGGRPDLFYPQVLP